MILWFTIVQLVVAVVVGAVALILGLAGRRPSDLTVGGMALVLVLLLAQVVIAIVAPASKAAISSVLNPPELPELTTTCSGSTCTP